MTCDCRNYQQVVKNLLLFQIEAGWLRHDLGHMSMFGSTKFNRLAARVVTGYFKVRIPCIGTEALIGIIALNCFIGEDN